MKMTLFKARVSRYRMGMWCRSNRIPVRDATTGSRAMVASMDGHAAWNTFLVRSRDYPAVKLYFGVCDVIEERA